MFVKGHYGTIKSRFCPILYLPNTRSWKDCKYFCKICSFLAQCFCWWVQCVIIQEKDGETKLKGELRSEDTFFSCHIVLLSKARNGAMCWHRPLFIHDKICKRWRKSVLKPTFVTFYCPAGQRVTNAFFREEHDDKCVVPTKIVLILKASALL